MASLKQADVHLEPFLTHNSNVPKAPQRRQKWRLSLFLFVGLTAGVLVINTIFLVWAVTTRGTIDGKGTLYEDTCDNTRRANIGIHLLINVLSSMLLGASNYCMQCLSAPSRSEVDAAHSKGRFFDIGVPSLHNIGSSHFASRKKICWWILALSSFPLHLCYNSVVFPSISAQTYGVYQFNSTIKAAIEDGSFVPKRLVGYEYIIADLFASATREGRLERLEPLDCINAYSESFQSSHGNVFLIANDGGDDDGFEFDYPGIERTGTCSALVGTEWVFQQFRNEAQSPCFAQEAHLWLPRIRANASDWKPFSQNTIAYCLSEPVEHKCKLNFSVHLAVIVIIFNVLKMATIVGSIFALRNVPLLTVGDAISSFLRGPDSTTFNMCLISQDEVHKSKNSWRVQQTPRTFTGTRPHWSSSIKRGKLITCIFALSFGIVVLAALFAWGYAVIQGSKDISSVLGIGLGTTDPRTIIQSGTQSEGVLGILANVFVANSPQVIISLIYFSYNATITSMLLAHEWSGFFTKPKGLRVSGARAAHQRSTYFLQLPYRYGVPLLLVSILLHWLASQSIFVVSVEVYNMYGQHRNSGMCTHFGTQVLSDGTKINSQYCGDDFITCAYSPLGILLSLLMAVLLALALFVLSRKRLSPMPVVGSCSVAIAASCHARSDEDAPWEKHLAWGVIPRPRADGGYDIAHCGLSSWQVERPVVGSFYT